MAHPNWANRTLFHGDNLDFLRAINSETVDLIATDPPFNKGRDFHATPDSMVKGASFQDRWSWDNDVHEEWIDKITDDYPNVMTVIQGSRNSYGDDMGAFLCFMGVRLLEMHRILKTTGSIYLHCDDTAVHYLKELLDAIFNRENFRNEIVWERTRGMSSIKKNFRRSGDRILRYTKSNSYHFENQYAVKTDEYRKQFPHKDEQGYFSSVPLLGSGKTKDGETGKVWQGIDPNKIGMNGSHWLHKLTKLDTWNMQGKIFWPKKKNGLPRLKHYWHESKGVKVTDIWTDIKTFDAVSFERTGYPTQKPLALYERIIQASSKEGDIVLDPFCGCATTCVAAERLNRQWVGIDIWDKAHKVVIERLKKEGYLADTDKGRDDLIHTKGMITYSKKPPKRTDGGSEAVPFLETKMKEFDDIDKDPYSNAKKKEILLEQHGSVCQGCGIRLHERYLELDHKLPRADGGSNLLRNRILLCGPCNKLKRHLHTISWLRKENKKLGYMIDESVLVNLK